MIQPTGPQGVAQIVPILRQWLHSARFAIWFRDNPDSGVDDVHMYLFRRRGEIIPTGSDVMGDHDETFRDAIFWLRNHGELQSAIESLRGGDVSQQSGGELSGSTQDGDSAGEQTPEYPQPLDSPPPEPDPDDPLAMIARPSIPIWVWIVAGVAGLLVLMLLPGGRS